MSIYYDISVQIKSLTETETIKQIIACGLKMGALYYDLNHENKEGIPISDVDLAFQKLSKYREGDYNALYLHYQGSGSFLFFRTIGLNRFELSIVPFGSKWRKDFFYIYDLDIARYSRLLLDMVSNYEIDIFEEIREDAQRTFIFLDEVSNGSPIIEICLFINLNEMARETIEEILNNAISQHFIFLDANFKYNPDVDYLITLIYNAFQEKKSVAAFTVVDGYFIKLFFKISDEGNMVIGMIPEEPFATKVFDGTSACDAQFYLAKCLGLAEGFFIWSFYAQGF